MAKDFDITSKGLLVKYTGNSKDVVIPDSVTSIGDCAFGVCGNRSSHRILLRGTVILVLYSR